MTESELPNSSFHVPRGLSLAEVKEYIDIWAKAAERAAKAGFDGVEINGASCHQINTFFSRVWNKREDEYGCRTLETRAAFMCDIVREVKKRLGRDFAVSCLLNIAEYGHEKGTTVEEGIQFARLLQDAGADVIQCRAWSYGHRNGLLHPDKLFYPEPPDPLPKDLDWSRKGKGAFIPLTEAVKKVVSVPVFCAGRFDHVIGEKYLREGKLDFIGMTRRLLADPELPNKIADGRPEDIRPCTGCLHCIDVRNNNQPLECQVNAALGREKEYEISPAGKRKRVMVIGGGPAGMETARVAALRGHEVTLFDKTSKLGGMIPMAAMVKEIELDDLMALISYFRIQLSKEGVKVVLNKSVTAKAVEEYKPDVLVIAAGAKHNVLNIPGSNRPNVINSSSLHKQLRLYMRFLGPKLMARLTRLYMPIGKRVVIIGGAIQGCELAEFLIKRHRKVAIVHSGEALGEGIPKEDLLRFLPWLDSRNVPRFTGAKNQEINDRGLVITTKEGENKVLEADTIIVTLPFLPNIEIAREFEGKVPETYVIGSCAKPGLIVNAIAEGAHCGLSV